MRRKPICSLVPCLALAVCLSACSSQPQTKTQEETQIVETQTEPDAQTQTSEAAQIPNPMEPVSGPEDYQELGVYMPVPQDAQDLQYFILNQEVADVHMTLDGVVYNWRASNTAQDFAGIFERFKEEELSHLYEYDDGSIQAVIRTTDSGGRLAQWQWQDTKYTLYTASSVSDETIQALTDQLVQAVHQGPANA